MTSTSRNRAAPVSAPSGGRAGWLSVTGPPRVPAAWVSVTGPPRSPAGWLLVTGSPAFPPVGRQHCGVSWGLGVGEGEGVAGADSGHRAAMHDSVPQSL